MAGFGKLWSEQVLKSEELALQPAGSGEMSLRLNNKTTMAKVAVSGEAKVTCIEQLKAKVAGSGNILYKGNPKTKNTNVSGSGSIRKTY